MMWPWWSYFAFCSWFVATVVGRPALVERCFGGAYTVIDVQYPYNSPGAIARGFGLLGFGAVCVKKGGFGGSLGPHS